MSSKRCSLSHFLNLLLEAMFAMPERTRIKRSSWLGAITRPFEGLPPTAVYLSQPFTVPKDTADKPRKRKAATPAPEQHVEIASNFRCSRCDKTSTAVKRIWSCQHCEYVLCNTCQGGSSAVSEHMKDDHGEIGRAKRQCVVPAQNEMEVS